MIKKHNYMSSHRIVKIYSLLRLAQWHKKTDNRCVKSARSLELIIRFNLCTGFRIDGTRATGHKQAHEITVSEYSLRDCTLYGHDSKQEREKILHMPSISAFSVLAFEHSNQVPHPLPTHSSPPLPNRCLGKNSTQNQVVPSTRARSAGERNLGSAKIQLKTLT